MKQFFVLGLALLVLVGSGCATRSYARRQAATVNDRVTQVQTQVTAQSNKHETDVSRVDERITLTDNKLQEAATSSAQANANSAQANASAARDEAIVAQAAISDDAVHHLAGCQLLAQQPDRDLRDGDRVGCVHPEIRRHGRV